MTTASTTQEPRWLSEDQQQDWRAFLHGGARLLEALDHDLRETHQISLAEYDVLARLSMSEDRQRRMAELALSSNQSRSRLSHTVRRLEEAGYITRCPTVPGDGRGVIARLTDSGYALLVAAAKTHVTGVRAHFVDIADSADFAAMGRVFRAVEAHLDGECGRVAAC